MNLAFCKAPYLGQNGKHCDLRFFLCNNFSRPKILTKIADTTICSSIVQYVYVVLSDFVQSIETNGVAVASETQMF